jgi:hypothetical protein
MNTPVNSFAQARPASASRPMPPDVVEASLRFVDPDAPGRPAVYLDETESPATRSEGHYQDRPVRIHNGRPLARALSVDREGFALVPHASAIVDFNDEDEIARVYVPETERLVAALTGAHRVVMFDHTRRTGPQADTGGLRNREPVRRIHNDYTFRSGPQRVRDLLPDEADRLLDRRFAIFNVWRPMVGPLQEAPLALCDQTTMRRRDWIDVDLFYRDRVGETWALAWQPDHQWYWFPDMRPDEVVLIKSWDSAEDGRARWCAHSAFDDPTMPADAPPRASIEARLLAFF